MSLGVLLLRSSNPPLKLIYKHLQDALKVKKKIMFCETPSNIKGK
jgi:hypothetical protein